MIHKYNYWWVGGGKLFLWNIPPCGRFDKIAELNKLPAHLIVWWEFFFFFPSPENKNEYKFKNSNNGKWELKNCVLEISKNKVFGLKQNHVGQFYTYSFMLLHIQLFLFKSQFISNQTDKMKPLRFASNFSVSFYIFIYIIFKYYYQN